MKRTRGFTLIELMVVVGMTGIMSAAVGAYYLETRIAAARIEAQVLLEREASLVAEALGRDLRFAAGIQSSKKEVNIQTSDGERVTWRIDGAQLVRLRKGHRHVLHRHMAHWTVTTAPEGFKARFTLHRPLIGRRNVEITRAIFARGQP